MEDIVRENEEKIQLIDIKELLNYREKKIIVFGAGKIGFVLLQILEKENFNEVICFDNNLEKQGKKVTTMIGCVKPYLIDMGCIVILASQNERIKNEMNIQCVELGYKDICEIRIESMEEYINELSDEEYIPLKYVMKTGQLLNLNNPITFNEKLQWLKLYFKRPEYSQYVDKCEVKRIVGEQIGEKYIIPLLSVWDDVHEIDFALLPKQFVLKCTHDSGSVIICKDKLDFNWEAAKSKLKECLDYDYYQRGREQFYKGIKPRIIAEKLMMGEEGEPPMDYKFFCFHGEPKLIQVDFDRFVDHKRNVYTIEWELLDVDYFGGYKSDKNKKMEKVKQLDEMLFIARKISKDIPFVRVDMYVINQKVYFGEMTFFPTAGYSASSSRELDELMGSWISLEKIDSVN